MKTHSASNMVACIFMLVCVCVCSQGPVLDWINAVQAMQDLKMEIPVNLKVIYCKTVQELSFFALRVSNNADLYQAVAELVHMQHCLDYRITL